MEFGSDQGNLFNTAQELYRKSIAIQAEKTNAIAKSIRDEPQTYRSHQQSR